MTAYDPLTHAGTDWDTALCAQPTNRPTAGRDRWFPDAALERDRDYAAAICDGCPLITACADYIEALEGNARLDNRHGISAGMTPQDRAARNRKQRRTA